MGEGKRFALTQSWWIASELVRRHPDLVVIEATGGGGQYDVLEVLRPGPGSAAEPEPSVAMNRNGTIHILNSRTDPMVPWTEIMTEDDPHSTMKRLERIAGWGSPTTTPATTPKGLTYRICSALLSIQYNAREAWDIRSERDPLWGEFRGYVSQFPTAIEALRSRPSSGPYGEWPQIHFWAALRDGEPVAVFEDNGSLHTRDSGRVALIDLYVASGKKVTPVVAQVFAEWLG